MKSIKVKKIMVPLADYATVSQDASLHDAVLALKEAQTKFKQNLYRHRAVLVYDDSNRIVGKLGMFDVLHALEPRYKEIDLEAISRFGYSSGFIKSALEEFKLWENPLDDICRRASRFKVKDIMHTPTQGEYVDEDAGLNEAVHQFLMGHHQSLLVTRNKDIVGILRLADVFYEISIMIERCYYE
jgi:CBS domain containing-hemolysin-like protein